MERQHAPGLYEFDIANQVVVVSVIGECKGRVNLIAIDCVWVDRPSTDHRDAFARNFFQHVRMIRAGWADQNFSSNIVSVVAKIFAKRLAKLLVDAGHPINRTVEHRR